MSITGNAKDQVMQASRERKLAHFYSLYQEGMSVLDVGVSSEARPGLPARNYFLKRFRYPGQFYTGLGVQDLSGMTDLFPGKRFVQYSGGTLPFKSQGFDWAFSNAVIEHVGDGDAQLNFLNEMLRVAAHVFFTTPNKYFPIESHTNVPFLHWNDRLFYQWCSRNKPWVAVDTLNLLSYSNLERLLGNSRAGDCTIYRNRLYGLTMTFSVICRQSHVGR